MTDVLTLGETMGAFRAAGPFRLGGTAELTIAGAESNVAIGVARLGHAVRWAGVTGEDEIGSLVRRTLLAEQVDVSAARTAAARTGLILFEPRTADITRVLYYRSGSAGSLLSTEDVRRAFDAGVPRIVHVTGITCALSDTALAAVTEAIRLGREAGSTISFDVNFRAKLWSPDVAARVIRPLLKQVDVLIASDDELPITGDHEVAEVVVKHGANGATARTSEGAWTVPAHQVTAVDTTGAGDAFVAGYLSGLLDGLTPAERLQRGNAVAAFAVATPGDWQGLPTRTDLDLLDLQPGSTVR